ncbi:unnamed protein product [Musa hybrid cultivar]
MRMWVVSFTFCCNRYKESVAKSTNGRRERLFSRRNSVAGIGCEVGRQVGVGIWYHVKNNGAPGTFISHSAAVHSDMEPGNNGVIANRAETSPNNGTTFATSGPGESDLLLF